VNAKSMKRAVSLLVISFVAVTFLSTCGTTIRSSVPGDYDWAGVNKICVIGISDGSGSFEVSRALSHHLFETGYPVVVREAGSFLDIYDIGRQEGADVIAYGTVTKVDVYYGHTSRSAHHYPTKEVKVEIQFIETQTQRRIWKGEGALTESANVADEFVINEILGDMVSEILPPWKEVPRVAEVVPMLKLGQQAPPFEVRDVDGNPYALQDDLGKNVVVLSFWSFFCDACKRSLGILADVNHSYHSEGVSVIAVSVEGPSMADRIGDYVREEGFEFTFLVDEIVDQTYEVSDSYNVPGTPALYVIGKSGEIVFARSGHVTADELSRVIESELAKSKR